MAEYIPGALAVGTVGFKLVDNVVDSAKNSSRELEEMYAAIEMASLVYNEGVDLQAQTGKPIVTLPPLLLTLSAAAEIYMEATKANEATTANEDWNSFWRQNKSFSEWASEKTSALKWVVGGFMKPLEEKMQEIDRKVNMVRQEINQVRSSMGCGHRPPAWSLQAGNLPMDHLHEKEYELPDFVKKGNKVLVWSNTSQRWCNGVVEQLVRMEPSATLDASECRPPLIVKSVKVSFQDEHNKLKIKHIDAKKLMHDLQPAQELLNVSYSLDADAEQTDTLEDRVKINEVTTPRAGFEASQVDLKIQPDRKFAAEVVISPYTPETLPALRHVQNMCTLVKELADTVRLLNGGNDHVQNSP